MAGTSPACPTLLRARRTQWGLRLPGQYQGAPKREVRGFPEGWEESHQRDGATGQGTHSDGNVDTSGEENLRILERMTGCVDCWLPPLCSGLARDLCLGRHLQLREMNLPLWVLLRDSEPQPCPLSPVFNPCPSPAQTPPIAPSGLQDKIHAWALNPRWGEAPWSSGEAVEVWAQKHQIPQAPPAGSRGSWDRGDSTCLFLVFFLRSCNWRYVGSGGSQVRQPRVTGGRRSAAPPAAKARPPLAG